MVLYFHIKSSKKEILCDGFVPIQHMIYSSLREHQFQKYLDNKDKYNIVAINTDSLFITDKFEFKNKNKNKYKNIGKDYFEMKKPPTNRLENKYKEDIAIVKKIKQNNIITLKDEYDTEAIAEILSTLKNGLVLGVVPGTGKTTLIKNFIKNDNYIIVTPYNLQASEFKNEGLISSTLDSFVGLRLNEEEEYKTNFKYNEIKYVLWDEIFCHKLKNLNIIDKFMKRYPDIIYFATGDSIQLSPIEDANNNIYNTPDPVTNLNFYQKIIHGMFDNIIELSISKRHPLKQSKILIDIKQDLFINKMKISDIIKKYNFPIISNMKEAKGFSICYFNETVKKVSRDIHNITCPPTDAYVQEIDGLKYWIGLNVISRSYLKIQNSKKCKFN